MGKIYIKDEIVKIVIDLNADLTSWDQVKLEILDPEGNKILVEPNEFDGRYIIQYPSKEYLEIPGTYFIQPIVSIQNRIGRGDTVSLKVNNYFE